MHVDVLADDDCVVNDDPQNQQKGEHRQHVQRLPGTQQHGAPAQHGDRNPQGHPERQLQFQENRQDQEHQQQPLNAVPQQQVHAVPDVHRHILPPAQRVTGDQVLLLFRDVFLHLAGDG